jgi:hypothetical protein
MGEIAGGEAATSLNLGGEHELLVGARATEPPLDVGHFAEAALGGEVGGWEFGVVIAGYEDGLERKPWRRALRAEADLPSTVAGPVERRALAWLAAVDIGEGLLSCGAWK